MEIETKKEIFIATSSQIYLSVKVGVQNFQTVIELWIPI